MKIVIKIGTSSLTKKDGSLNKKRVKKLVLVICKLMLKGHNVVLVTSGAVGLGKKLVSEASLKNKYLRDKENSYDVIDKSFFSGIGQGKLISYYLKQFLKEERLVAQVLVEGKEDIYKSYFIDIMNEYFNAGTVAIINANDTIYNKELIEDINHRFSDNDILAAEVSKSIKADKLILITNVDGYLDENNVVVSEIAYDEIDEYLEKTDNTVSNGGTGGMCSKLRTGKIAECDTYIISNSKIDKIGKIIKGKNIGTKIKKKVFIK